MRTYPAPPTCSIQHNYLILCVELVPLVPIYSLLETTIEPILKKNSPTNITLSGLQGNGDGGADDFDSEYVPALRLQRIFAYVIDVICLFFILVVVKVLAAILGVLSFGLLSPLLVLAIAVTPLAYHSYLVGSTGNATLGMRFMNIRVRTMDGRRPDYATAFLHCLIFYASMFLTSGLILLVSLFTRDGRCLHDMLTNSQVVQDED